MVFKNKKTLRRFVVFMATLGGACNPVIHSRQKMSEEAAYPGGDEGDGFGDGLGYAWILPAVQKGLYLERGLDLRSVDFTKIMHFFEKLDHQAFKDALHNSPRQRVEANSAANQLFAIPLDEGRSIQIFPAHLVNREDLRGGPLLVIGEEAHVGRVSKDANAFVKEVGEIDGRVIKIITSNEDELIELARDQLAEYLRQGKRKAVTPLLVTKDEKGEVVYSKGESEQAAAYLRAHPGTSDVFLFAKVEDVKKGSSEIKSYSVLRHREGKIVWQEFKTLADAEAGMAGRKLRIINLPTPEGRIRKGFLAGSFNPPHVGHFELLKEAFATNDEVTVVITTADRRHNIPFSKCKEIWEMYAKTLNEVGTPKKVNIILSAKSNPYREIIEIATEERQSSHYTIFAGEDRGSYSSNTRAQIAANNRRITSYAYVIPRDKSAPSATALIAALKEGKSIADFFPPSLSRKDRDQIVKSLVALKDQVK